MLASPPSVNRAAAFGQQKRPAAEIIDQDYEDVQCIFGWYYRLGESDLDVLTSQRPGERSALFWSSFVPIGDKRNEKRPSTEAASYLFLA
jgi:hypothetical protein